MTTSESATVTERLTISVDPAASGGILRIAWDRTEARIPIAVIG